MHQPLWQRAASFAARAHRHARRDDGETPYFSHPARVAMAIATLFGHDEPVTLAAAYLHDVLENTDHHYDDILTEFGREVADMVAALTKNPLLPEKQRDADYSRRLLDANWRARLIKLADELDNYIDTRTGMKDDPADEDRKARIAMRLAKNDAAKHPEVRTALKILHATLKARRIKA